MRTNSQTKENLDYINMNCIQPTPNDLAFPYLFYRNNEVALHNRSMLLLIPGKEILIDAIDE
jgi:hypothetical protein